MTACMMSNEAVTLGAVQMLDGTWPCALTEDQDF